MTFSSPLSSLTLVLGGARSGKSTYAETLVLDTLQHSPHQKAIYIATAQAFDDEMRQRIALHKSHRQNLWETIEEPLALTTILQRDFKGTPILIDCLTLWLSNLLLAGRDPETEQRAFLNALRATHSPIVCVSNEVGLGIVPDNALARRFRDAAGRLNQACATCASRVVFLAAGLPLTLKS